MEPRSTATTTSAPGSSQKKLFTPGPLCVSPSVKEAMLVDLGSRDNAFINTVSSIRHRLLSLAEVESEEYTSILLQGSGTYAVEAVFSSTISHVKPNKVLVLENGAYGKRMELICNRLNISNDVLSFPEDEQVNPQTVAEMLQKENSDNPYAMVAVVHCETSSGVINPVEEIARIAHSKNKLCFVDAMSSFGAVPLRISNIDLLVSSANKCIQGVPGFSFVIARKSALCEGRARSVCLDLVAQWRGLEGSGQFRFTPPTHAILAFDRALSELDHEGGVLGRQARYKANREIVRAGMAELGFVELLDPARAGYIITAFKYPEDENFNFDDFYRRLSEKGQVIYPGKITKADCFRIGNIGHLFPDDMRYLLKCIKQVCREMNLQLST